MLFALAEIAGWIARLLKILGGTLDTFSFLFLDFAVEHFLCFTGYLTFLNIESHLQLFVSVVF